MLDLSTRLVREGEGNLKPDDAAHVERSRLWKGRNYDAGDGTGLSARAWHWSKYSPGQKMSSG